MTIDFKGSATEGLWSNNIVFGQLLALCPLLAVTGTATNGLGMGIATITVLVLSGFLVSLFRNVITPDVRIPEFVLKVRVAVPFPTSTIAGSALVAGNPLRSRVPVAAE